jgi:amino acid adenylation domain-containing protein/non-ribosomal peptide synthase protein (TIGR01720 family)
VARVVGLLGVLKAGAAYLPLDPSYPASRLRFMVADCGVRVVLAGDGPDGGWPDEVAVLPLDGPADAPHTDARPAQPGDLAYVIYTSGSTGRPKGVAVTHAALADRVRWMRGAYALRPGDRVLQFAPVSFDTHAEEVYPCLSSGATLVVPEPELSIPEILRAPIGDGLTVLDLPTPYWHELVRAARAGLLQFPGSLRLTIIGADQAHTDAVAAWHELVGCRLVNTYGPTEATIVATAAELTRAEAGHTVPIGRPIANTRVYVLDGGLDPAPVGVVGEVYIGGTGLARGYVDRPGLTAQRFVPDPFGGEPGGRLYRTGDLGRWRPDGVLEFAGRIDDQVKVRGFRIELGEVERTLAGHPAVGQVVVSAREDGGLGRRLVAYVAPADGAAPVAGELREFVAGRLPEYMVPAAFVTLDRLPLMANGKVDRAALPAPEVSTQAPFRAPGSAAERVLAQVWQDLLGVDRVGLDDNFFELGGDSIVSIQVVAQARARGVHITPRQMFRHQTVGALAAAAATATAPAAADQGPVTGTVPFTPIQRWFVDRELGNRHHVNQSVLLSVPVGADPAVLERAIGAVVAHHDALRLRLRPVPGGWEQYVAALDAWAAVPVSRVDLTGHPAPERPARLAERAAAMQASLDLERGPLLRCALFTLGAGERGRLFITIHHLAVDTVSWQILLDDIERAYHRLRRGEPAELGPRTTSIQAYGEWLWRMAGSRRAHADLPHWRQVLDGAPADLPIDHHDGDNDIESVDTVAVELHPDETEALLHDLPRVHKGAQVVDAVLAALAGAVAGWTGQRSLLVDLEAHGRDQLDERIDLTRTVGWFTSVFPVRVPIAGETADLVGQASQARRSTPHGGIGYGVLRHLSPDGARALAGLPTPPISVNYLGRFDRGVAGPEFFGPAEEDSGPELGATGPRPYLLELNGGVFRDRLEVTFAYSRNRHRRETVERLAGAFLVRLRELARPQLESLPLSPSQHGLLFDSLRHPDRSDYIVQLELLLHGELDPAAFRRTWQLLARRHAILRTAVRWEGLDQPWQDVHPGVELPFVVLDWRHLTAGERERQREAFLAADRATGFDLGTPPLARVTLIRAGDTESRLVMTYHHLLLDGWGSARLLEELFASYARLRVARTPRLAPVRPYRDYLAWLRARDSTMDEAFWRAGLAGFTAPTPVGSRRVAAAHGGGPEAAEHVQELTGTQTARLAGFCRRHRITLSTLLHGAWALVLGRNAGVTDVVFGVTLAGRPPQLPGVESMVGLFINTLPLRVRLGPPAPDQPLVRWLRQLQEDVAELREYEASALVDVHGWSDVPRGQPLFDSIVVFENYPTADSAGAPDTGIAVEQVQVSEQTSYPLTIAAMAGERLVLRFSYRPDRLDAGWVERVSGQLVAVLDHALTDPDRPLATVSVLPAAQRRTVVEEWNDTAVDYGPPATLGELFTAQAGRTPDAVAVRCDGRQLTYAELSASANRVAHRLRALGVGPESVVGVCAERGVELVAGLLGVLKAGAAYLPLDPGYPPERLAFMVADSGARVLLTGRGIDLPALPAGVVTACLDELGGGPDHEPVPLARPEDLAYVIYTSGSTGRPKGVMITHAAIGNRLRWMQAAYQLTETDHVLQKTPSSFDVSVWEFFWPLLTGARLVLAKPGGHRDPAYLRDLVEAERVTTLHFVPSMLQAFLDQDHLDRCRSLRRVICSGEELPAGLAREFFARLDADLHNLYGPTEVAVDVTSWRCDRDAGHERVPIGWPIANTRVYLLDGGLNPVPVGVPGEVYLGGAGLARGYLGRPGLTAQRFVPDPFDPRPGGRLYRTGDLARYRDDGAIEFLGRTDHQVKVRGFRIELGEVEATLAGHPGVRQAVVVARDNTLAAYVVPADGVTADVGALREFVAGRLPEYMVPSPFVALDRLPLTVNGKVDRAALPTPELPQQNAFRAPESTVERAFAGLWQELLGVDRVGLDDSFFDLGGHSLLAMRFVARAGKLLPAGARPIRVMDVFAHPTVGGLAELATGGDSGGAAGGLLHRLTAPVPADQRRGTLVCVPYGGGSAVVFQPLADALPAGFALYAVALPGHDPGLPGEAAQGIDALARRCADELAAIPGPLTLYGHCLGGGALTVALALELEARGRELAAVYIGGSFPSSRLPGRVSRLLGRVLKTGSLVGDRTYYHLLKALGGFRGMLGEEELAQVMRMLRHDVREAEDFYARAYAAPPERRLRAPLISVVAERDPTTELHEERYLEWLHFGGSVALVVLPGSDHYFLNSQARQLAAITTTVHCGVEPPGVRARVVRPPAQGLAAEPSRLASLRVFGWVAGGQLVSMVGSGLTGFALGLWVYLTTGSLTRFALVEMFAILPGVLVAPVAGAIVDRTSRQRVMLVATVVGLVTQLTMAALVWRDALGLASIFVLLSVLSVAGGFHGIAYLSAIPQLAPKRYLIRMNGLVQVSIGVAETVAPLIAVGLLAWIGIAAVLVVDAATFAIAAAVLAAVRFPRTLPLRRLEPLRDEIVYGFRYLAGIPGLRWLLVYFCVLGILTAPLYLLIVPLVLPFGSVGAIGWLFLGAGLGVLLGGLLTTMWGGPRRLMAGVLGSSVTGGLAVAAIGLHPSLAVVGIGLFGWVLSAAVFQACYASIVQLKVPLAVQGRVFAVVQMVSLGVAPIAYLATGPLGDHVFEPLLAPGGALADTVGRVIGVGEGRGIALMFLVAGAGILLATLLAYRSRAIWRLEDDLPDALPDEPATAPPPSRYFDEPIVSRQHEGGDHDGAFAARA